LRPKSGPSRPKAEVHAREMAAPKLTFLVTDAKPVV
jgi:hypothetical protein